MTESKNSYRLHPTLRSTILVTMATLKPPARDLDGVCSEMAAAIARTLRWREREHIHLPLS